MSKFAGEIRKIAPYLTLGIQIMLTLVVPIVAGVFIDRYFGSTPWGIIIGIILGFGGFFNLLWRTFVLSSDTNRDRKSDS